MLTRDRIQETLDDAASRGRVTRKDANELVAELVAPGSPRRATSCCGDLERSWSAGRGQLESPRPSAPARSSPSTASCAAPTALAAVSGVGPSFPILGYDDLNANQVQSRIGELTKPELRKVLTYERKHANRKSVIGRAREGDRLDRLVREAGASRRARRASGLPGARRRSAWRLRALASRCRASAPGCHPQLHGDNRRPGSPRPQRGDELELTIDSLAFGGAGVARTDGYVVFVSGAIPGDRVRAVIGKRKRAYAEARAVEILEPSPERIEPRARPSRGALAGAALRAPARGQAGAGATTRCDGSASSTASTLEPIVPALAQWRYRNKLEYSFGTGAGG